MLCGLTIRLVDVLSTTIAFAQAVDSAVGRPEVPAVQGDWVRCICQAAKRWAVFALAPRVRQTTMDAVSDVATKAVKAVEDYRVRHVGSAESGGHDGL